MAMNTRAQAPRVPDRAAPEGLEAKWGEAWESQGTYAFDRTATREQVYSIDTPPPTVSGSLHIGHVFSYTHTDVVARYQRMMGKSVFYPMGWDDNGLPTERRVQNYFGVRVDATLPYDPDFEPPHVGGDGKSIKARDQKPISRKNFVELCERLTQEDEAQFEALWRYLGLSVDWKQNYQTIGARARKVAQAAFLRNLARGEAYQAEAPGLWDVTFQTAVAQAELESREYPGFYHRLAFHITDAEAAAKAAAAGAPVEDGVDVCIETTRPELLAACVALIAHPDDERYKPLFGTTVASPVYGVEVPILPHPEAEMDKGAGIAMCCTFGDTTDIDWWRDLELPLRAILRKDGRIITETPEWITTDAGRTAFEQITGKTTFSAREAVVAALRESGELKGEPTKTMRQTNFFEKGDKPLEIVTSRQWYIRNGGRAWTNPASGQDLNDELIGRGRELEFHPDFMRVRYENWVKGLKGDWLVSRQRFFGVPFPLWYRVDADGQVNYDDIITPSEAALPVDPSTDVPEGYTEDQRGVAGGFVGELGGQPQLLLPPLVDGQPRHPGRLRLPQFPGQGVEHLLAVAQEVELRRGARCQPGDGVQHLGGIEHRCLVDAHQHVARMHAGLLGRTVAHHAGDDGAFLLRWQLQRLGQLRGQVLRLHADVAPDHRVLDALRRVHIPAVGGAPRTAARLMVGQVRARARVVGLLGFPGDQPALHVDLPAARTGAVDPVSGARNLVVLPAGPVGVLPGTVFLNHGTMAFGDGGGHGRVRAHDERAARRACKDMVISIGLDNQDIQQGSFP